MSELPSSSADLRCSDVGLLRRSLNLLYVYAIATGAIFTFMAYWDGMFLTAMGPATFLGFALMTLLCLSMAFVYCELSAMLPSCGVETVYGTVGLNKHFGFWASWLILAAWLAVPPAGMMGIIDWINYAFFGGQMSYTLVVVIAAVVLTVYFILSLLNIELSGIASTVMLFLGFGGCIVCGIIFLTSDAWSWSNFVPFWRTAMGGGGESGFGGMWGMLIGLSLLITPYFGFEVVPRMVEEGTFPIKDMNKAIWGSVVSCGIIYTWYFFALAGMAPWEVLTEGGTAPPFVTLKTIARSLGTTGGWRLYSLFIGVTCVLFPIGTSILGFWVSGVRMLYAMGRSNFLPKAFARTNRFGQPVWPNIIIWWISLAALIVMTKSTYLQEFYCLMAFACAASYAIVMASAIRMAVKYPHWPRPYKIWGGQAMRILALIIAIVIAYLTTQGQPGWRQFALYLGLGALLWLWMIFVKWPRERVWMETPEGIKEY